MRKKTKKSLVVIIFLFVAIVLTAISASAACDPEIDKPLTCVDGGGYDIRIVEPFPIQGPSTSTFIYQATVEKSPKNITAIDVLVVNTCPGGNDISIVDTNEPNGWKAITDGIGSTSTLFGEGVYQFDVFEQNFQDSNTDLITTKASAGPTSIAFKVGTNVYYGEILGPTCYDPKTASVVSQTVQLDPQSDPNREFTIIQDPSEGLTDLIDENGNSLGTYDLNTDPIWVCVDPILDAEDDFSTCGGQGFLPITHMPDGVAKFGNHTCYAAFIAGRYSVRCY